MDNPYVILTILLGIFCLMNLLAVALVWSELRAMQKSTHSIQYIPVDKKWPSEEVAEENLGIDDLMSDNI